MLSGDEFLQDVRLRDPRTGLLFQRIINGINNIANHLGVDPDGKVEPPPPHAALNVQPGQDMAHVSINNPAPLNKNIQNFVEWSNDSGFSWHVEHLNAQNEKVLTLPTKNGDGTKTHDYIFRSYSQYLGSDAQGTKTYLGSATNPTVVNLTGTAQMDLLPAVGSGTAAPDGQQGGQGLGTVLNRPAQGPKRPAL